MHINYLAIETTMPSKTKPPEANADPSDTIDTNIRLPRTLHAAMKLLQVIQKKVKVKDVHLCDLFREAVEQYLNAKPQAQLLKEWGNGSTAGHTSQPRSRGAGRV